MILAFRALLGLQKLSLADHTFKQPFILVLYKFSVCKNNAHVFGLLHRKVLQPISVRTSKMYLAVLEILPFGNQFPGVYSTLRNAVVHK